MEGELVLAGKDRQFLVFNILKPVLQKLLGRNVVFVTPGPRYLEGCCDEIEHASNRFDEGFEDGLRRCLAECRQNFKDFLFTSGYRGFRVIDPSPALPGNNDDIWDWDPVHPSTNGYESICDLIEGEFDKFSHGGTKKRPAESQLAQEAKKRKVEVPRPRWVRTPSSQLSPSKFRESGSQGTRIRSCGSCCMWRKTITTTILNTASAYPEEGSRNRRGAFLAGFTAAKYRSSG